MTAEIKVPAIRTPLAENVGQGAEQIGLGRGGDKGLPGQIDTSLLPGSTKVPLTATREYWLYWGRVDDTIKAHDAHLDEIDQDLAELIRAGTHADRLLQDPALQPLGALWSETDRGGALYQVQPGANAVPAWQYIAGTMFGTLSPDQRPTDLATKDAGFDFRTTDINTDYAPREFMWSGTQWIEITQVLYGTHASRPAANSQTPARTMYVETDRGNVIYQQQSNAWRYVAGTMWGTMSPDQRPTGLGTNDAGFLYGSTDQPPRSFVWNGSSWIETTPAAATVQQAISSASLALTGSYQTVPGLSLTLTKAGRYLIEGTISFNEFNDANSIFYGGFFMDGVNFGGALVFRCPNVSGNTVAGATVSQQAVYTTATTPRTLTLQATKTSGTGSSTAEAYNSSLTAIWLGP